MGAYAQMGRVEHQAGDAMIALAWFAYVYCYKGPR